MEQNVLFRLIKQIEYEFSDGYVFDLISREIITSGVVVNYTNIENWTDDDGLFKCLNSALLLNSPIRMLINNLGKRKYYCVRVFPTKEAAIPFAIQNDQPSIFNLTSFTEYKIEIRIQS